MLINLKEILTIADHDNIAIGAFNTPNLECINAVIDAAERLNVPVIISHAELHEDVAPLAKIGPVMVQAAKAAKVPVCVHLDHCETLSYMKQALELGFTGVMYDGSTLSYEENLENTKKAVAMASQYNCGVEAELGAMAAREGGEAASGKALAGKAASGKGRPFAPTGPVYTDPDEAVEFCKETKIDALAPSFGTAHGIYKNKPILDFERVKEISIRTRLPLVMHGGSGVSPEDYRKGIECGLRKINYYSYMAKAGTQAVIDKLQAGNVLFFHDLALAAQKAMEEDVEKAMRVFAGL
jgi:fructose-bisphosphate aldolase class II